MTTDIVVNKVWSDGLDVYKSDVVSVSLFANGVEFDKQDLSAGNDWNYCCFGCSCS